MEYAEILTGMEAGDLWEHLRQHIDDPARCHRCGTSRCAAYRKTRAKLIDLGLLNEEQP